MVLSLPAVPAAGLDLAQQSLFLALALAGATGVWLVLRSRNGVFRGAGADDSTRLLAALGGLGAGGGLGRTATFVQFSSAHCSTCPQVSRVLEAMATARPGVVHVELRTEDHPDLVRSLGVMRTPTVLLLDGTGALRSRSSGPLRPEQAAAALQEHTTEPEER